MTHDAKTDTSAANCSTSLQPQRRSKACWSWWVQVDPNLDEPAAADTKALTEAVGKTIEVKGTADHSPKTKEGAHPVYKLKRHHEDCWQSR